MRHARANRWTSVSFAFSSVDSRSLSAAALNLGVTRSNVSHRLKMLEREAGAQLLRRLTRSIDLTEAGRALYEGGRRMLEELSTTRATIDRLGQTLSGHVRISVPTGFGRMLVAPMLLEFMRTHPGISLSVVFNNRIQCLIAAHVDVALTTTINPPPECVARCICPIRRRLFASSDYLLKHGPIETLADLQHHTLVGSPYFGQSVALNLVQRECEAQTATLPAILQSADFPFLTRAVSLGIGIRLLPGYSAYARQGTLQPILPSCRIADLGSALYVRTMPNRFPSPSTRALIDNLCERIAPFAATWGRAHRASLGPSFPHSAASPYRRLSKAAWHARALNAPSSQRQAVATAPSKSFPWVRQVTVRATISLGTLYGDRRALK
ncbi:DNA-binding transcriptional regulator, LysR family [Burkholderia sp. YR290]|nr:DNA-binding transcriptional regulator, LysR family [Paraburkholderia hospita]SOE89237.1 DNA-binding transcriptional regulator, LysR family [Burkholderia sp. YR290]